MHARRGTATARDVGEGIHLGVERQVRRHISRHPKTRPPDGEQGGRAHRRIVGDIQAIRLLVEQCGHPELRVTTHAELLVPLLLLLG
ncbi:MAG: hypothetical protein ACK559_29480, partial [bacterium]